MAKQCKFGCGTLIEWNDSLKCFVNEGNKQRHDCRSMSPSTATPTATQAPKPQPDTVTRIAHETVLTDIVKSVVDNANKACKSFQFELKIVERSGA